ncbi:polymorphic toxin-type HINT domain-containing protein [Streptomyces lavendulae]
MLGQGTKNLVEITIDTDGSAGTATQVIAATDKHPFWAVDLAEWVDATDLQVGQWLRVSSGTRVQISEIKRSTSSDATVHNLTVADLHTYYVLAGAAPVLVHNCGGTATVHYDPAQGSEDHAIIEIKMADGRSIVTEAMPLKEVRAYRATLQGCLMRVARCS